ncbi:MAG: nucleotidyltransferase domain-containing protein [Oscillospiraceae bacterium]|jgi:predicted nucleotidyltransferase|nr:nucleotidyltransferase domain-containing protein [Oscillospiraceae bacterium]
MDKEQALAYAREYARAVYKEMNPEQVVLYGSYAKGNARADSDIDIAVIFNGLEQDWFQTYTRLAGLTWKISTYIEPILLDRAKESGGFISEVLRTGQPIII